MQYLTYSFNLHPDGYCQESHYYPFAVNLKRYATICNALKNALKVFDTFKKCIK